MSRSIRRAWLTAVASVAVCLGVVTAAQAQVGGAGQPPIGGPGQPGVGVGVGVGVGGVGVGGVGGVGVGVDVNVYQGPGLATQYINGQQTTVYRPLDKWYYYPYYYFPHNYWPQMGPKWPENPGECTLPPPAYMAYPPFREPNWRYEWYEVQRYYKGFHFWLDQF